MRNKFKDMGKEVRKQRDSSRKTGGGGTVVPVWYTDHYLRIIGDTNVILDGINVAGTDSAITMNSSATSPSQDLFEDTDEAQDTDTFVINVRDTNNESLNFTIPDTSLPKADASAKLPPGASDCLRTSRKLAKATILSKNQDDKLDAWLDSEIALNKAKLELTNLKILQLRNSLPDLD